MVCRERADDYSIIVEGLTDNSRGADNYSIIVKGLTIIL